MKKIDLIQLQLQIAASEARKGHIKLANDIKNIIDKNKINNKIKEITLPLDTKGLVISEKSEINKSSLIVSDLILKRLEQIIFEYFQRNKLKNYGLEHRRKILLVGNPGTGKTMTAKVLAHELHLPLFTIQTDRLITKFMGETSSKLRQIFDMIKTTHGVYLFDEFDAIGSERSFNNDVGKMRRVLGTLLQFIEQDDSDSLIIATTNNSKLLDRALFRRFDDLLHYEKPLENERLQLFKNLLYQFTDSNFQWLSVVKESEGMSQSDITKSCMDAIKKAVLKNKEKINIDDLYLSLLERKNVL